MLHCSTLKVRGPGATRLKARLMLMFENSWKALLAVSVVFSCRCISAARLQASKLMFKVPAGRIPVANSGTRGSSD